MPALINSGITGKVTWIGAVLDRSADLASAPLDKMQLSFAGPVGEDHGGETRQSCSRVITQYPKGTIIRNVRQLSLMSEEELSEIASDIGVETFDPKWAGCNLVIQGIPDFTHLPPSSRLQFSSGATITIDMENQPCHLPAPVIDRDAAGKGRGFKSAAKDKRGVTAWVEREGLVSMNDTVALHIPAQRAWQGAK